MSVSLNQQQYVRTFMTTTDPIVYWETFVALANRKHKMVKTVIDIKVCSECKHETPIYETQLQNAPKDRVIVDTKYPEFVSDPEDQKRIVLDWFDKKIKLEWYVVGPGMFSPADNIRCLYNDAGYATPQWFVEKYGQYLKKDEPVKQLSENLE